ncbi:MAG TPA: surface lipoprotein assembly modifier [Sphingobium sp.]|nr:surface lipoprotein assembly modifier [Sphingobium sp.]
MTPSLLSTVTLLCALTLHGASYAHSTETGPQNATDEPQPAPAGTGQAGNAAALTGLSAAQLFDLAEQARAAGHLADAEAIYTALGHDPDLDIRSEARFRLGMMLADQQRHAAAALAFRAILDEQPDAARVRLELARMLAAMGDDGRARQQLRQAQASGLPPDVAQVVDRFATALRSNRRFGGNIEFAMAPDSNINRATDARTLDTAIAPLTLSDDARQQSGLGAHLTGQIYARLGLGERLSLVPRLSGDGTFYRQGQFNDVSGSALIGIEWQAGRDRLIPSVGITWRTYGGQAYARTQAADIRWTHRLGKRAQTDMSFSYGRTHYLQNSLQDGNLFNLGIGLERALSARSGVGLSLSGSRQTARDASYATTAGGLTLLGWRDMGKVTLFANATARRLEADAAVLFAGVPLFGDRRREWFLRAGAGATFRQIEVAGFAPVVRLAYERNISTVGIYDYRRVTVDIGITRAF